jgi:hypothetical protein
VVDHKLYAGQEPGAEQANELKNYARIHASLLFHEAIKSPAVVCGRVIVGSAAKAAANLWWLSRPSGMLSSAAIRDPTTSQSGARSMLTAMSNAQLGVILPDVPMTLAEHELAAGPWCVSPLSELVSVLLDAGGPHVGRPRIVAVDGRSGSGKTIVAERLRTAVRDAEVVHTDDIAWWHSRFGWHDLMIDGVLETLHRGQSVHYQPPAWASRGRAGQIDVSAKASVVIIEGVGAAPAMEHWDAWMTEEIPFLAADRPWERATIIVSGTPDLTYDPIAEVVIAAPMPPA